MGFYFLKASNAKYKKLPYSIINTNTTHLLFFSHEVAKYAQTFFSECVRVECYYSTIVQRWNTRGAHPDCGSGTGQLLSTAG